MEVTVPSSLSDINFAAAKNKILLLVLWNVNNATFVYQ